MTEKKYDQDRWQKISDIIADCLALPAHERDARARALSEGDKTLYDEIARLLAKADDTEGFLVYPPEPRELITALQRSDADAFVASKVNSVTSMIDRRLGPYRIVEEIARGGMGSVFKAVRADDAYEKIVAIKLIRSNLATEVIAQRFRAERQILANFEHQHIARLIDGGQGDDGDPYLVIEYIDGLPIDRYCEERSLSVSERLRLFRDVCAAVQYAHQRLVVHRDLKPSNILVDRAGTVKLLDFGIAKLLDQTQLDDSGKPIAQPTDANAMTPAYASPEQIKGDTITTASDVYALGVLLYRLLTGKSPYKHDNTQPLELAKEIVDTEPPRPSERVTADDSPRPTEKSLDETKVVRTLDTKRLQRELSGDLDNIVLMALRKEPNRRYSTVEQLSEDIRRSQANEPVLARADTWAYRAKKFVQRNALAVGGSAIAAVALLVTAGVALHQADEAKQEKARAERHFENVRELANTMYFDFDKSIRELPGSSNVRDEIAKAAIKYLESASKDAAGNAKLLSDIGMGYVRLAEIRGLEDWVADGKTRDAAAANLEKGIVFLESARKIDAKDPIGARRYGNALRSKASFEWGREQQKAAEQAIAKAIYVLEEALEFAPDDMRLVESLAGTLSDDAVRISLKSQSREQRIANAERSKLLQEKVVATASGPEEKVQAVINLALYSDILADLKYDRSTPESRLQHYELRKENAALVERQLSSAPQTRSLRRFLGQTYLYLSGHAGGLARWDDAIVQREKSVAIFDQLVHDDPSDKFNRTYATLAHAVLVEAYAAGGKLGSAEGALRESDTRWERRERADDSTLNAAQTLYYREKARTLVSLLQAGERPQAFGRHCSAARQSFRLADDTQADISKRFGSVAEDDLADVRKQIKACEPKP